VQRYHDRVARCYDDSYDDVYWRWHDGLTWDLMKQHLPKDANAQVVDLGCGTGKWGAKLAKSGFAVTGVDISAKMLDKARVKWEPLSRDRSPQLIQADLADMAMIEGAQFDLAVAMGDPIGCTSSPLQALREIRRILRADGVLIASFDNRLSAIEFHLQSGGPDELEQFLKTGKTHWLTRDADEQFPIFTYGPTELRKLVAAAGFAVKDLVGSTVLPMRHYRSCLDDPRSRRQCARMEKSLCRDPGAMGRASHLHIVCTPLL
jgi:ubiquinone/menaquinone biosynthesis C-methylase UbiE